MERIVRVFPSADREFDRYVRGLLDGPDAPGTAAALQAAVRRRYPAAVVRAQDELARHGSGPATWYVFRAGSLGAPDADLPTPGDAWAIVDDDRRFLEVSDALAAIAEVPAAALVGHRIEEFTNPDDPSVVEDIERLYEEFLRRRELVATLRFDHLDGRHREVAYRLAADDDGPGRHRLSVRVTRDEPTL